MQKTNWKRRALEMREEALNRAEELKTSKDPRSCGIALMLIGKAKLAEDLLREYGVDVEKEDRPKIKLAS